MWYEPRQGTRMLSTSRIMVWLGRGVVLQVKVTFGWLLTRQRHSECIISHFWTLPSALGYGG